MRTVTIMSNIFLSSAHKLLYNQCWNVIQFAMQSKIVPSYQINCRRSYCCRVVETLLH